VSNQTAGWTDPGQVEWYLDRVDRLAPRVAAEELLGSLLPPDPRRLLDLGCGDGRLAALALEARPSLTDVVALDRSPPMLDQARQRFGTDPRVTVGAWDMADSIASFGDFDVIVSGMAIHHLVDGRKQSLLGEVAQQLRPGGLFANLEVVSSATPELHAEFLAAIGRSADDPEDKLVAIETQLAWMRAAGLTQVDCLWRWRGFALLVGRAASS
jgi:tRNA (cmo5U34)-methyltransferase